MVEQEGMVLVARETVENGIVPWVGRRYEKRARELVKTVPHDPLVRLVPSDLFEAYRAHSSANSRITRDEARRLGLAGSRNATESPFVTRLRRMLGNPDA